MMIRSVTQLRLAIKDSTHKSTDSRLQALIPEAEDFELMEAITPTNLGRAKQSRVRQGRAHLGRTIQGRVPLE